MQRGVLLEVRGRQGILLTGTGEFRRVDLPAGGWQVGEEIAARPARAGRPWLRTVVAVAAAVLVLFGGPTGYWQWSLLQPSVVLAMEINPTVEFTINGKGNVNAARGLNPDGEVLLQGIAWQNQPIEQVVKAVTERAVATGKFDPASAEGAIVVTVVPVKGEKLSDIRAKEISTSAQVAVETAVHTAAAAQGKTAQAQVASTPTTAKEAEEARAEVMTLPEYVLYKSLLEAYPEVKPETFRQKGPGAALKELGILPSEAFSLFDKGRGKDDPASHDQNDDHGRNSGNVDKNNEDKNSSSGQKRPEDNGTKGGAPDKRGDDKAADDNPGASSGKGGKASDPRLGLGLPGTSLKPEPKPDLKLDFGSQHRGSDGNKGQGSTDNKGQGSTDNRGQGSTDNKGQGSTDNKGQGSTDNKGQGSDNGGKGRGSDDNKSRNSDDSKGRDKESGRAKSGKDD